MHDAALVREGAVGADKDVFWRVVALVRKEHSWGKGEKEYAGLNIRTRDCLPEDFNPQDIRNDLFRLTLNIWMN